MKKYILLCTALLMFGACSDVSELNVDTKNPQNVPANSLVANATVSLFDLMSTPNVNRNNLRLWAQHWAQVSYSDESNYELVERNVHGRTVSTMYATVIRDLREARNIVSANENLSSEVKANQMAVIDVLEAVAFTIVVDIFGDMPYSEAFDPDNVTPAYDDDASIYSAMISQLNNAISALGGSTGDIGDLIYGGDADAWKRFANSYKLRLAIRMADSDNAQAQSMAESAVSSGVFASNADNFVIAYEGSTPNTNPLWEDLVQSGRSDFIAGNTLVDYMNSLNDPRRQFYFKQNVADPNTGDVIYVGGTVGAVNSFTANSQIGSIMHDPTHPGTIMGYTEVLFLLADAAERGYNVGSSAEDFYNAAVTNSIMEWGGGQTMADDYLGQADVAYSTAPGTWKEKIGLQKWIAMYDQGLEAWTTFRLYDAPVMNVAEAAGTVPPNRYTYPVTEYSVNTTNVEAAAAAMGGDDLFSKVFWDVN